MGAKVTFRQDQNACRSMGFKLVKGSANDCKAAPFSDSIHNFLEMGSARDPHTIDATHQVAATLRVSEVHLDYLRVADFIYN